MKPDSNNSCARCGQPKGNPKTRFCSIRCGLLNRLQLPERQCRGCAQIFRPKLSKYVTFCARECFFAFKAKRKSVREALLVVKKFAPRLCGRCRAPVDQRAHRICLQCRESD